MLLERDQDSLFLMETQQYGNIFSMQRTHGAKAQDLQSFVSYPLFSGAIAINR